MDDTGLQANSGPGPLSRPNFGDDDDSEGGNNMIMANKNPMGGLFKNKDEQEQFMTLFRQMAAGQHQAAVLSGSPPTASNKISSKINPHLGVSQN